jgi:pyrroloquinoline quinone biosynthesis protein B
MQRAGVGQALAAQMGHLPISGPHGSLEMLSKLNKIRRIYVHINNTNPILIEDSAERKLVASAGIEVGMDGMEIEIQGLG